MLRKPFAFSNSCFCCVFMHNPAHEWYIASDRYLLGVLILDVLYLCTVCYSTQRASMACIVNYSKTIFRSSVNLCIFELSNKK